LAGLCPALLPIAGAGEHASSPIATVCGRGESDDQEVRVRITEARYRVADGDEPEIGIGYRHGIVFTTPGVIRANCKLVLYLAVTAA